MTTRLPRIAVSVALLLCLTAVPPHEPLTAEDRPRIVAIGDIHGAHDEFTRLLDQYSVSHFVVGHTILSRMRITARFGARAFLIDTGMLSSHYQGGQASALVFGDDRITAVYFDERIPLVDPATTPPR